MKKYSFILVSVLMLSGLSSCSKMPADFKNYPESLSDSESVPANTPVYKCTEYSYKKDGSRIRSSESLFDEHDNVIQFDIIDAKTDEPQLSDRSCYHYLYDEKGNILKKATYKTEKGILSDFCMYTYNADGTEKDHAEYNSLLSDECKKAFYECYKYDSKGNVTNHKVFKSSGDLCKDTSYKYKYDGSGNMVSKTVKDALDEDLDEKYTYTYDDKGSLVTEKIEVSPSVIYEHQYTYDDNGNKLSDTVKSTGLSAVSGTDIQYTYDEKGRLVSETDRSLEDGTVKSMIEYEYEGLKPAE